MAAKKATKTKTFILDDNDGNYWWANGSTPEEAVADAISEGCEFEGDVEIHETKSCGVFKFEKKLVGTKAA